MLDVPLLQPLLNPVSYLREDLLPGVGQLQEELVARPGENLEGLVLHPAPPDTEGSSLQHPTSGSTHLYSNSDPIGLHSLSLSPWTKRNGVLEFKISSVMKH